MSGIRKRRGDSGGTDPDTDPDTHVRQGAGGGKLN
jgi:hypothetical protein